MSARLGLLALLGIAACGSETISAGSDATAVTDAPIADTTTPPKDTPADTQPPKDVAVEEKDTAPPVGEVLVPCPVDKADHNHSKAEAYDLADGADVEDLFVCVGADDWFRFDLAPGKEVQVQACTAKGGPAVEFAFFRAEFEQPASYLGGGSSSPSETCEGTALWEAPGTYYFHVSTLAAEAAYRLEVHVGSWYKEPCKSEGTACSSTSVCTGGFCTCKKDALEPNDTPDAAATLALDEDHALVACVADDDWLKVEAAAGDTLAIHVETSALVGQGYFIGLGVYAADDPTTALAYFPKATYSEDYSFEVPAAGVYLLRVQNVNSHGRSYTIRVGKG